jgi:hypothetical protein
VRRESSTVVALVGSAGSSVGRPGSRGPDQGSGPPGRGGSGLATGPGHGGSGPDTGPAGRNQAAADPAGPIPEPLLAELDSSANVAVVRPPAHEADAVAAATAALGQAARRSSPFALVPADPLADVAAAWQAMWDLTAGGGMTGTVLFEERAARALAAWRARQFELPDYYLVLADALTTATATATASPEFHLGPLRAARPNRVVVVSAAGGAAEQAAEIRAALRTLPHGRWWPPLDEVLDIARRFNAGGLAEAATTLASAPR